MSPQISKFPSGEDGGADTAPQSLRVERTLPKPPTDSQRDTRPISQPAECFKGISPEEVGTMMEEMNYLVGATGEKMRTPPVQPYVADRASEPDIRSDQRTDGYVVPSVRLRYCTLMTQAEVAESCFDRLGAVEYIEKAIECRRQILSLVPNRDAAKPYHLSALRHALWRKYERFGDLASINGAIQSLSEAVQLIPGDHPENPMWLNNLGISYMDRFNRLGELSDLETSIERHTKAVQLAPDSHPDKLDLHSSLGSAYIIRFERFGELSDLDNAIQCLIQVVQLTPDSHSHSSCRHSTLGSAYIHRFNRLGEPSDLDYGIRCLAQAVQLTPDGHPHKPTHCTNLGSSYLFRYERLGELSDMDNGIEYHTQAVQLTPDGHPKKSSCLNNLGGSYLCRFKHLGNLSDLDDATECYTQAVQLTPVGNPSKPRHLNNLGMTYFDRFKRLGELSALDNSIKCQTQAVQLTPDGHPDKPVWLGNLGDAYLCGLEHLGAHEALRLAQSTYQQGAQLVLTSPRSQLRCARKWAKASALLDLSPQEAYERCMELVPHLIWLGATVNHRYTLLTDVSNLAAEAASWAISVQSYDLALEWLEEGRSIVWNQILQLRTPFDELSVVNPALSSCLKRVASQLEALGTRQEATTTCTDQPSDMEKVAQHHRRLAAEWEKHLNQARSIPGFENFMKPRKASELKLAAKDGPVILINTHSARGDALVILPGCDDITHIPLDKLPQNQPGRFPLDLDYRSVSSHRGEWDRAFKRVNDRPKPEDPVKMQLAALWQTVVKPILDGLGCTHKLPTNELPHVTWCATGPLALAPLHATGPYDGSSLNAFDVAISSYTPSLSALLASSASVTQSDIRVLAIGQQNTPGLPSLPSTVHELAIIKEHVPSNRYLQLDSENATVEAVLAAMDQHTWVHLACHATQNPVDPAHSAFHLHDGNLTLEAITKRQFKNKGLAFLSACQTAKGDGKLPDEAVHLAAGMLMAGYPSVIATMWSIADIDGPEVAGRVYEQLLKDGKMDHRGAARALHIAVAELREKIGLGSFERWVPFIHIGV